jgi:lipopolysaccharide transport system ATP-binding protein
MSSLAIKVEDLSKKYRIGTRESYKTFRETVLDSAKTPFRRLRNPGRFTVKEEIIWALKEVSFEVKQGDILGIIGRNGAGKTTLLKIFSRITEPTKGRVILKGRIASLLEVGTGFHPELTGKENIFLNGAILGMTRREINRKFDEIVAFAEVEKFLDTPVKRYSSGMYMRLAFAVAAHLEPDILLIDEVLAVGDAAFQKKCLGKMDDVSKEGRTVLFVSHNMGAIQRLCPRSIILDSGRLSIDADTLRAVRIYLKDMREMTSQGMVSDLPRESFEYGKLLRLVKITLLDANNRETNTLRIGEPFSVLIECVCNENINNISFVIGIDTTQGDKITTVASEENGEIFDGIKGEKLKVVAYFDDLFLNNGEFSVRVGARTMSTPLDLIRNTLFFEVADSRYPGALHFHSLHGLVRSSPTWRNGL